MPSSVWGAPMWFGLLAVINFHMVTCRMPLLNNQDMLVKNVTDTSVALVWPPIDASMDEIKNDLRLIVTYQRLGYSPIYLDTYAYDPDCSLLLSHCRLTGLAPESTYSVIVTIDHRKNATLLGRASQYFTTEPKAEEGKSLKWWLIYVGAPSAGVLILLIIVIIIVARCYRCCCWHHEEMDVMSTRASSVSSSRQVQRSESHATRQWVQDTFNSIEPDPPSTYDHPVFSPNYSSKGGEPKHSYLQMHDFPGLKPGSQNRNTNQSSLSCLRSTSKPNSPTSLSYANVASKKNESLDGKKQNQPPSLPILPPPKMSQSEPPGGQDRAFPPKQRKKDEVVYTNTEDVNKLLGSAKKMFPML